VPTGVPLMEQLGTSAGENPLPVTETRVPGFAEFGVSVIAGTLLETTKLA
jgi:hypothetical protein